MVALVVNFAFPDQADIDVGAGAEIMVHTGFDSLDDQLLRLILRQALAVARLKYSHSR